MANVILLVIVAAITILLLVIKSNALYAFFALCAGSVLVEFANRNMAYVNGQLNSHLLPSSLSITQPLIEIIVLLLPPVLVIAFAKHNNGPAKWPIHVIPAVSTAILAVLFVVPLLSIKLQNSITKNSLWSLLEKFQVPIVGACVFACVIILILNTYAKGSHHSGKSHKGKL